MVKSSKKIIVIESILLVCVVVLFFMQNNGENNKIITNEKEQNILSSNAISMMYETEAGSGEYQTSTDTNWPQEGYIFNERLSGCENGGTLSWNEDTKRVIMQTNTADKCYVYFDIYNPPKLTQYLTTEIYNSIDGENDLYYHDGQGTYSNADQEANDNSYRYAGANPNNYICFGSFESTCPEDNLYRIIGIFDNQVKLIKYDYATQEDLGPDGSFKDTYEDLGWSISEYKGNINKNNLALYYWNINETNLWNTSELNILNLNTNFLNNIGTEWQTKVSSHGWQIGGVQFSNVYSSNVKTTYNNEIKNNNLNEMYNAKIGLMYVSDYGYAVNPKYWSENLGNYKEVTLRENNWIYMGLGEGTISKIQDVSDAIFGVSSSGYVGEAYTHSRYGVINYLLFRPVFYLNSDVKYISGSGTNSDPFRIN